MAEFTEQQVYEALGLGEQAQELAEPAAQASQVDTETGAQGQSVADSAQEPTQPDEGADTEPTADEAAPDEPEDEADTGTEAGKQPLTPQQRRENAARRRQQEQQAAIEQAVSAAVKQEQDKQAAVMEEFFKMANLKNTITGEPITSLEEFNAWNKQFREEKLQRDLKAGKLTPEGLEEAIGNHPIIQQAQQLIAQDSAAKQAQQMADTKAKIDAEIAQIHALDASINTLEDLFNAPYGKELYDMTQRGYSLKDAHYLLNREKLENAMLEAARQQGMNSIRSKEHMQATVTPRGTGAAAVPAADMAMFRQFNPGATDAEIQAYYNQYHKK